MKSRLLMFIKIVWIFACVFILFKTLHNQYQLPHPENDLFLEIFMFIASFPVSFVVVNLIAGVLWVLYEYFSIICPVNYFTIIIDWMIIFIAGYFQWFVIAPKIYSRIVIYLNKKKEVTHKRVGQEKKHLL